jgi:hypothetical protein
MLLQLLAQRSSRTRFQHSTFLPYPTAALLLCTIFSTSPRFAPRHELKDAVFGEVGTAL